MLPICQSCLNHHQFGPQTTSSPIRNEFKFSGRAENVTTYLGDILLVSYFVYFQLPFLYNLCITDYIHILN